MSIKKGDWVEVIDDTISGKVIELQYGKIIIETEDGFVFEFSKDEVVKNPGIALDRRQLEEALKAERKLFKSKSSEISRRSKKQNLPMEVDLHIEEITNSDRLSDFEMLNLQIETARRQLEFAIEKKIQRVVFIHGVGKGVLRAELETLFRRYPEVEFYDADFSKYGRGATEVYIYQNVDRKQLF